MTEGTKVTENPRRVHYDFRTTELIVKPRKPHYEDRPLIVVYRDQVWTERTGEITPRAELAELIATQPSGILACENAPRILRELSERFHEWDAWQWRVTPVVRRKMREHRSARVTESTNVVVNYFGFRFPYGQRFKTYYQYPIDTITFLGGSVAKVFEGDPFTSLIAWAQDVREFARENQLKVSPTGGGVAAQLLRDDRFFPRPRRKVPKATNEKARPHLPGNHYELLVPDDQATISRALYLDMTGAHHHAAARTTFPDPDRLFARGRYRNPPTEAEIEADDGGPLRRPWAVPGSRKFENIIRTHGLLLARVNIPATIRADEFAFAPPWLRRPPGPHLAYIFTNELPMIAEHGAILEGIEAAWTAAGADDGLNRYAEWSIATTAAMTPLRKTWAKATLLAAYGMLAARPRRREFGYRSAARGEPGMYMTSDGPLNVQTLRTTRELDSPVANVIARGMIEAEVRRDVLTLARELHARGCRVLALYADSIILGGNTPLPFLPPHWRVKTELTRLKFFNSVSFGSEELTRLPGIPVRTRTNIPRTDVRLAFGEPSN